MLPCNPPQLQLSEWMLDASLSGLDVCTCRKLLSCLVWAVGGNSHKVGRCCQGQCNKDHRLA